MLRPKLTKQCLHDLSGAIMESALFCTRSLRQSGRLRWKMGEQYSSTDLITLQWKSTISLQLTLKQKKYKRLFAFLIVSFNSPNQWIAIFARSDWLPWRRTSLDIHCFGTGFCFSFRDSFERWNFSGKWSSCYPTILITSPSGDSCIWYKRSTWDR